MKRKLPDLIHPVEGFQTYRYTGKQNDVVEVVENKKRVGLMIEPGSFFLVSKDTSGPDAILMFARDKTKYKMNRAKLRSLLTVSEEVGVLASIKAIQSKVVAAEIALAAEQGDDWFYSQSEPKQKQYIAEHPKSKYAKAWSGGQHHKNAMAHHDAKSKSHGKLSDAHYKKAEEHYKKTGGDMKKLKSVGEDGWYGQVQKHLKKVGSKEGLHHYNEGNKHYALWDHHETKRDKHKDLHKSKKAESTRPSPTKTAQPKIKELKTKKTDAPKPAAKKETPKPAAKKETPKPEAPKESAGPWVPEPKHKKKIDALHSRIAAVDKKGYGHGSHLRKEDLNKELWDARVAAGDPATKVENHPKYNELKAAGAKHIRLQRYPRRQETHLVFNHDGQKHIMYDHDGSYLIKNSAKSFKDEYPEMLKDHDSLGSALSKIKDRTEHRKNYEAHEKAIVGDTKGYLEKNFPGHEYHSEEYKSPGGRDDYKGHITHSLTKTLPDGNKITVGVNQHKDTDHGYNYYGPSHFSEGHNSFLYDGKRYSFERLGVESAWNKAHDKPLHEQFADQFARAEKAIEKKKHLDANGTTLNFGPRTHQFTKEGAQKIKDNLNAGKSFDSTPSGFGTGYRFSKHQRPGSERAHKDLENFVGHPVYYTKFDHD